MSVGPIDNCLTTAAPGDNTTHTHPVHVIIHDVEDMIGWQIRMNYDGGQMRPGSLNFTPFTDSLRGQGVSFVNLPIDQASLVHRDHISAANIPPAAAGPQTALVGSIYNGSQNAPISPDTPAKAVPDDTSYNAPTGGVVATLNLQVLAGNAGQPSLFMNLDDNTPNAPGSSVVIFTGSGQQSLNLASSALGDGYHGEGATCVPLDCVNNECPPPVAGHDARLSRIGGVPKNVRLSPGEVITDTTSIDVANQSNHTDTIGVYVDVQAPASGGCTPNGRVLETTVTLAAGGKTTLPVPVSYTCADPSAADGMSYSWTAVADHGADDLGSCGAGTLQGLTCFNALADDDEDPADNRKSQTGPKVIAQ